MPLFPLKYATEVVREIKKYTHFPQVPRASRQIRLHTMRQLAFDYYDFNNDLKYRSIDAAWLAWPKIHAHRRDITQRVYFYVSRPSTRLIQINFKILPHDI